MAKPGNRRHVRSNGGQVELALAGRGLGQVTAAALIGRLGVEVPAYQVRDGFGRLVGAGQAPSLALRRPILKALTGHRGRHRVH